jgi:hypothetical protein
VTLVRSPMLTKVAEELVKVVPSLARIVTPPS